MFAKDDDKFQSTVPGEEGVTCDFTIYQEGSEVSLHCKKFLFQIEIKKAFKNIGCCSQ